MLASTQLSKKELECLSLAAQDYSMKEASRKLQRTVNTVKRHRKALLRKLGCHTMAGAVTIALKSNLLDSNELTY